MLSAADIEEPEKGGGIEKRRKRSEQEKKGLHKP
jgi:hypothetical protein